MSADYIDFNIEALKARITVLEDFIKAKHPDFPTTPKGNSGTMTFVEEPFITHPIATPKGNSGTMTGDEHSHGDEIEGYITPKTSYGANIRGWASTAKSSPPLYSLDYGNSIAVSGYAADAEGNINPATGKPFVWYMVQDGDDNFVREDVVTFSKEPFITPINAALWPAPVDVYWVTTHHGEGGHKGIDYGSPMGTNIVNPVDAFVLKTFDCVLCKPEGDGEWTINNDDYGDGYGTFAILRYSRDSLPLSAQSHVDRYVQVLYGHMSDLDVTEKFPIRANSRIGRVGSTGNSSGPHLHLEVRTSDDPNANFYTARLIDPELVFST
jgi:murein DD-endopeptidase MepM/ murein hydrolase activator NlpD